ncbi:MAG: gamma carbonic anhydrase family protein [Thermoanaerobaculia bacterium]|nr:gamma carbonic anhydrase family protein [Thermoanaerobaculia bacterium]
MIVLPYGEKKPRLGSRVFVAQNATLIGDVELGDDVSIWFGTVLRGDIHLIRVGARTNIQDNCVLHVEHGTGAAILGDEVTVGHGAVVHGCTVENGALIGIGARVLSHAVIGAQALIGAGAVVQEGMHIPPRTLAVGVPARVKRELTADELARLDGSWKHYVSYKDEYLRSSSL